MESKDISIKWMITVDRLWKTANRLDMVESIKDPDDHDVTYTHQQLLDLLEIKNG